MRSKLISFLIFVTIWVTVAHGSSAFGVESVEAFNRAGDDINDSETEGVTQTKNQTSTIGAQSPNAITNSQRNDLVKEDCEQTIDLEACGYGKRFYRLSMYSKDQKSNVLDVCLQACNDSYVSIYQKSACDKGCHLEVNAQKYRQDQLDEYQMDGNALIMQARLNQLWSHWMFEMLIGFDAFNDWYSSADYEQQDPVDRPAYASTYVIIEQSNDNVMSVSAYRRIISAQPGGKKTQALKEQPDIKLDGRSGRTACFDSDVRTYYTRWCLCLLVTCSSFALIWLICVNPASGHRNGKSEKTAEVTKTNLIDFNQFSVLDDKPAAVHKSGDDVQMITA